MFVLDVLCIDAIIQTEEAHMELCRALRVSRSPASRLRLRIGKLDMCSLGVPRTVVLFEQLEPEVMMINRGSGNKMTPFPSNRHHRSSGDCLEGKRENYQVCSVQYCVQQLYTMNCTHI